MLRSWNLPSENDLTVVQVDVVDGTNGADVEGVGKTGILLGQGDVDIGLLVVNEAVELGLGGGSVCVLLLPADGLGIVMTGDIELSVTEANVNVIHNAVRGKVRAVIPRGLEIYGRGQQLALLGRDHVAIGVIGSDLGNNIFIRLTNYYQNTLSKIIKLKKLQMLIKFAKFLKLKKNNYLKTKRHLKVL